MKLSVKNVTRIFGLFWVIIWLELFYLREAERIENCQFENCLFSLFSSRTYSIVHFELEDNDGKMTDKTQLYTSSLYFL